MQNYLKSFFDDFQYEIEDADFLLAAYDKMMSSQEARELFNGALRLYNTDKATNINEQILAPVEKASELAGVHRFTGGLLIFICMSKHLKELYAQKGWEEEIFYHSMLDLRYKLEECKEVKGIIGSFVASWFDRFFDLSRVGLGRLQFEIIEFGCDYCKNGIVLTPTSKVLNIHIPRTGTPLDKESCDKAFAKAQAFFKDADVNTNIIQCTSWLLYPENKNILPSHTNVYRFLSEFDVYESGEFSNHQDMWRLFDTEEKNPHRLPTNGSLRRAYVEHLLKGGKTGWGKGIMILK